MRICLTSSILTYSSTDHRLRVLSAQYVHVRFTSLVVWNIKWYFSGVRNRYPPYQQVLTYLPLSGTYPPYSQYVRVRTGTVRTWYSTVHVEYVLQKMGTVGEDTKTERSETYNNNTPNTEQETRRQCDHYTTYKVCCCVVMLVFLVSCHDISPCGASFLSLLMNHHFFFLSSSFSLVDCHLA